MYIPQPSWTPNSSWKEWVSRSGSGTPRPHAGAIAKMPVTRSGCVAATRTAQETPHDSATRTARSTPAASITARASAAYSSSEYAAAPAGRSERPLPLPSNVVTRKCRDRKATCDFQKRDGTIDHAGSRTTRGPVEP